MHRKGSLRKLSLHRYTPCFSVFFVFGITNHGGGVIGKVLNKGVSNKGYLVPCGTGEYSYKILSEVHLQKIKF